MRLPARAITGHLLWGHDGGVWAAYRVDAVSFRYLPAAEKLRVHARVRAALSLLAGESMLLGVARLLDPGEVIEAMVAGVDLSACPAWRVEAEASIERVAVAEIRERRHYLITCLPERRLGRLAFTTAVSALGEQFGLPPTPIRSRDVAERLGDAALVEARLGRFLTLERVSAGELRWLYARATRRGAREPHLDNTWATVERRVGEGDAARVTGPNLQPLADGVFYEGGTADDANRPPHRRYLRVDTAAGTGYQALLPIADMPREFFFPDGGGEWFHHLDDLAFGVDWCARVTAVPNEDAQVRARRQARQLASQFEEHEAETAGLPHDLLDAADGVHDERGELAANRGEPELQASLILATWASDLADLEARCQQLQAHFAAGEYGLARPTGAQLELFTAMLPASGTPKVARDYAQFLLPRDFAGGAPFTGHQLGDPLGMPLAESLDGGGAPPILFDPARGPSRSRSGSVGVAGNLGSGKSYLIKRVIHATLARGGRVVALDRTERGEYVAAADVFPGRAQVVRLTPDAPVCLDPMRVLAGDDRAMLTTGFLTLLTQVAPTDLEGVALAEAVEAVEDKPDAAIKDVLAALERLSTQDEAAKTAFRKVRAMARSRLAGLVFDEERELLAADADYVVFHMPGLTLPRREDLIGAHFVSQLLPEQVLSQALLYLVAAITREVTFGDWSRFGAACLDEAWALTASPQGRQLVLDFVRDGRKHNAAVWLLSQHADDLGDDQLAHLLGSRFVFRQDPGAIPAALRFLGLEGESARELLTHAQSGQAFFRDGDGRIGFVQVLPAAPALHAAFDTTPGGDHVAELEPEEEVRLG